MSTSQEHRGPAFPSTRWSRILAHEGTRDLEALAQAYLRPVHGYLAARMRLSDEAARDLTQDAFAWLLETRFFDRADPARGRFRGLLKTALARFAIERHRSCATQKRGGDRTHEPLDTAEEPTDPNGRTPEQVLDDAWRRELLGRARAQLQQELEAGGRTTHWLVFRDYFLDDAGEPEYATLAARHSMTTTDVSNRLAYAKRRYREILIALVQETVGGPEELDEELRWLFGANA